MVISDLYLPREEGEQGSEAGGYHVLSEAVRLFPSIRRIAITANIPKDEALDMTSDMGCELIYEPDEPVWYDHLRELTKRLVEARLADRYRMELYSDEEVMKKLRQVVATDRPVVLLGETGTGKGHFAGELHEIRCSREIGTGDPGCFRNINLAALGEGDALLVQLFGAVPGFYTQVEDVPGLFELMDEAWTVFLDEIAKVDIGAQGALLKLLDERKFQRFPFSPTFPHPNPPQRRGTPRTTPPVPPANQFRAARQAHWDGANKRWRHSDLFDDATLQSDLQVLFPTATYYHGTHCYNKDREVRCKIVVAANVDLVRHVREGKFLVDLYNRLMCVAITIPPLRERGADYIRHKAEKYVSEHPEGTGVITPSAMRQLVNHPWKAGNMRELLYTLDAALMRAHPGRRITPDHLLFIEAP